MRRGGFQALKKSSGRRPSSTPVRVTMAPGSTVTSQTLPFARARCLDGVLHLRAGGLLVTERRAGPGERNSLANGGPVQHDQRVLVSAAGKGGDE